MLRYLAGLRRCSRSHWPGTRKRANEREKATRDANRLESVKEPTVVGERGEGGGEVEEEDKRVKEIAPIS